MHASRKKPGMRMLLNSSDRANVSRPISANLEMRQDMCETSSYVTLGQVTSQNFGKLVVIF